MKVLTYVLTALIAIALVLTPIALKYPSIKRKQAIKELEDTRAQVAKEITDISRQLVSRLEALGAVIGKDRDFSMKLLVEHDPSAPEVTELASQYIGPMGLDFLDIIGFDNRVVSSGHFPARAGVKAEQKTKHLNARPAFISDDAGSESVLSLQSKVKFECAGVPFYCVGGVCVDTSLLRLISPRDDVRVALKRNGEITGLNDVNSMSEIKDNTIIINDKHYLASSIEITTAGAEFENTELIILMDEPQETSFLSLLD